MGFVLSTHAHSTSRPYTQSSLPDSGCDEQAGKTGLPGHKYVQPQDIQQAVPFPVEASTTAFCPFPATRAGMRYTQTKTWPRTHACRARAHDTHTAEGSEEGYLTKWKLPLSLNED